MQNLFKDYRIRSFIAGLLCLYASVNVHFLPGWICFIPLLLTLQEGSTKKSFKSGFIFGLTIGLPSYYWMMAGAQRFTGHAGIYGYLTYFISAIFLSCYFGAITYGFFKLKFPSVSVNKWVTTANALLAAALFVSAEALLTLVSTYMPWFGFHAGNPLMDNIYTIQIAAYFGTHGLTFFLLFVNYLFAAYLFQKNWKALLIPFSIALTYVLIGYFLYQQVLQKTSGTKPVSVAILNGNIDPEISWNDANGQLLVDNLLDLDRKATALHPNMAIWSESAIPWTYQANDPLVNQILQISAPAQITHILGMNTDYKQNVVYNSIYALQPNGKVSGRYDKRILLALIEQPLFGIIFPFLSSEGFLVKSGENSHPLNTPYGKAGIMVCNESSVASTATDMANNGAQFLFNLSNDGWFSDTYIVKLHFYSVMMRAVETRKDIAFNSNKGISGLIKASGEIALQATSDEPFVKTVQVSPNSINTFYASCPFLLVYISIGIIWVAMFFKVAAYKRK